MKCFSLVYRIIFFSKNILFGSGLLYHTLGNDCFRPVINKLWSTEQIWPGACFVNKVSLKHKPVCLLKENWWVIMHYKSRIKLLQLIQYGQQKWKWKWKLLSRVQLFVTPWTITVHGILQTRILEWIAIPFSRGSSWLRNQPGVSCIAEGSFTSWTTKEDHGHACVSLVLYIK